VAVKKAKATIKKVAGKLKKASKAHAGQAKALSAIKLNKGGSTVNKAGNYTKPTMRKNQTIQGSRWGLQELMPHYTKPLKKVIKTLTKIEKDQRKGYKKVVKKKKKRP
jgi:hypothetical protein